MVRAEANEVERVVWSSIIERDHMVQVTPQKQRVGAQKTAAVLFEVDEFPLWHPLSNSVHPVTAQCARAARIAALL